MRVFARPSALRRLSLEARLVYSGFCLFMALGYGTTVWFYLDDDLGLRPAAAVRYYHGAGHGAASAAETATPSGGPALDLPADLPDDLQGGAALQLAKSPRQVMETFHFHLFSVSVCLLILAHLFMMCGLSTRLKASVVVAAYVASGAHVLAPPLIRLVHPGWAVLMFPSALAMGLTWVLMTLWPLIEMWVLLPPNRPPA